MQRSNGARFYARDGTAQYEVIGKTTGTPRPVTIADARKNGWLPSVTTVLKVLAAPGLEAWKQEQLALVLLTTPRKEGEAIDAFVHRVLHEEQQQEHEAQIARDLGTDVHRAIEQRLNHEEYDKMMTPYVMPAVAQIEAAGKVISTEKIVVGDGYAGKLDVLTEGHTLSVWDIKTTRTLPTKRSWDEHRLQLSAYARTLGNTASLRVQTANIYVSTSEPGQVFVDVHDDWQETFEQGFKPVLGVWQWLNDYRP